MSREQNILARLFGNQQQQAATATNVQAPATSLPAAPTQQPPAQPAPGPSAANPQHAANGQPLNHPGSMDGQQQQQMQGNTPQQQHQQQEAQPDPNGQQGTEANPLDFFATMYDNADNGASSEEAPVFALDPEKLTAAASKLDFTKDLDPELLQGLASGDLTKLPELLNAVGRASYSQALQHGAALTDKFVGQHSDYQNKQLAPMVRDQLTQNELNSDAGGLDLSNPVVARAVADTAKQLSQRHPTLPPSVIAQKAKEYHIQLASTMLGMNAEGMQQLPDMYKQQQQQAQSQDTDWDAYFSQS